MPTKTSRQIPLKKTLGVCYYPEHWPQEIWENDARQMAGLGITYVRIGEFAWSRLEPGRGAFDFSWLDKAIEILHAHGLKVVLGTPTATPPRWLVEEMPDMLAVDKNGATRTFGSRRHYSFSHPGYRDECKRIVTELAKRYGKNEAVVAWQTDNEYDCHDTTLSFSPTDKKQFQNWLAQKYQSPHALNKAWGNVFWSMEIDEFSQIDLPNLTVTEANPAHWMDFHRFASDQVVEFNRLQVEIIRKHAPTADIIHNFMGRTLAFDHFKVGADIDISSWDSYPLGFLEDRSDRSETFKKTFSKTGDADFQAFHHDLYRSTSNGRWWVMEQQPGPVNWAPHNPAPREGMVRLWALEAYAHGAETVSYFRWRQAPFAQEQMHSGLLRSDSQKAPGYSEAEQVHHDLQAIQWPEPTRSRIAIVFDYASAWAWKIQPQGTQFDYFRLVYDFYKSLRALGLSVDFISADASTLEPYELVIIPGLFTFKPALVEALRSFKGHVLIGPRSGSKTPDFQLPANLGPDLPKEILDIKISHVESLRSDCGVPTGSNKFQFWREFVETGAAAKVTLTSEDGHPALI